MVSEESPSANEETSSKRVYVSNNEYDEEAYRIEPMQLENASSSMTNKVNQILCPYAIFIYKR